MTPGKALIGCLALMAAASGLALEPARGQTATAASPIFGYYRHKVPAGNSVWVAGLVAAESFAGRMTGVTPGLSESTIRQSGVDWNPDEFAGSYLELQEGIWKGLALDIISNTNDTLTIAADLGASGFQLEGDEKYAIRNHATLDALLPGGAGLEPFLDIVKIYNESGTSESYTFDGNGRQWVSATDFKTPAGDQRIKPGQGFVIFAGGERTLLVGGGSINCVKTTQTRVPLSASQTNLAGIIDPIVAFDPDAPGVDDREETTVGAFNLPDSLSPGDEIELFRGDGTLASRLLLGISGGGVIDAATSENRESAPVRVGTAIRLTPAVDTLWTAPAAESK